MSRCAAGGLASKVASIGLVEGGIDDVEESVASTPRVVTRWCRLDQQQSVDAC